MTEYCICIARSKADQTLGQLASCLDGDPAFQTAGLLAALLSNYTIFHSFPTNLQRNIDLTNAFKSLFRDDSLKPCNKIAVYLGKQCLGCFGWRVREAKGRKAWNLQRTVKELLIRSSGKSLGRKTTRDHETRPLDANKF